MRADNPARDHIHGNPFQAARHGENAPQPRSCNLGLTASATLAVENLQSMFGEERRIGEHGITGEMERLFLVVGKIMFQRGQCQFRFEARREYEPHVAVERYQPAIEGSVVQTRKAKAVADVETFRDVLAPKEECATRSTTRARQCRGVRSDHRHYSVWHRGSIPAHA